MRIPIWLSEALLGKWYQKSLEEFFLQQKWIESAEELTSDRFLARSIKPHILRLSDHFNRIESSPDTSLKREEKSENEAEGLAPYWKSSQQSDHTRMAYFLTYFPNNFIRSASVLLEVFERSAGAFEKSGPIRVLELGSGPAASSAAFLYLSNHLDKIDPTRSKNFAQLQGARFAWIESDKKMLQSAEKYFEILQTMWGTQTSQIDLFHRRLFSNADASVLPVKAPQFDFILSSFFWNELHLTVEQIADAVEELIFRHLSPNGFFIWIDPALKTQSRKLLAVRKLLLARRSFLKHFSVQLPCLGHQVCEALENPQDWCHEEVVWWRPELLRKIDTLTELDHRRLPFSYLVIQKKKSELSDLYRLVSPSHQEGKSQEFFTCGKNGKHRTRLHPKDLQTPTDFQPSSGSDSKLERGDILSQVEWEKSESNNEGTRRVWKIQAASLEKKWNPRLEESSSPPDSSSEDQ